MSKLFISYVISCVRHNLFEKVCQKSEKPDLDVLEIGKFSALDFYEVFDFFATGLYYTYKFMN
jgi:hypothetical protein